MRESIKPHHFSITSQNPPMHVFCFSENVLRCVCLQAHWPQPITVCGVFGQTTVNRKAALLSLFSNLPVSSGKNPEDLHLFAQNCSCCIFLHGFIVLKNKNFSSLHQAAASRPAVAHISSQRLHQAAGGRLRDHQSQLTLHPHIL